MSIETIKSLPLHTSTCAAKPQPKIEHKVKKFIRRVKEKIARTHCRIRYDSMLGKWAVLKDDNSPHHHFEYGTMTNVTFTTQQLKGYDSMRCSYIDEFIGIAEGDLRENDYGDDAVGYNHMGLDKKSGAFVDSSTGNPITRVSTLRIMTERRALYKE